MKGWICAVVLVGLALLAYAGTLGNYFLADDYSLIASFWDKGGDYLLKLLVSDEIGGAWNERFLRPARIWSMAVDRAIWGLNPVGFHLTDVLLHVAAALAVFGLVLELGGRRLAAFGAATLFLLHPLNVETVAWSTGRDESLGTAALLTSLLLHLRPGRWARVGSWLFFTVSLLTKEYAILFPVALLALPLLRLLTWRKALVSSFPYWVVLVAFLGLRLWAFGSLVAGYGAAGHTALRPDLFATALWSFARSFVEPIVTHPFLGLATLLTAGFLAFFAPRAAGGPAARRILYWGAWFLLFIVPTHNLIFTPRHLYLSFAGLSVGIGLLLSRAEIPRRTAVEAAFAALLVVLLIPSTIARTRVFARSARMCEAVLSQLGTVARSFEPGDVLVLVGLPMHDTPPWGFGWSLVDALGPPFFPEKLDNKVTVVTRREWRDEAWARYRDAYPGRRLHVLRWNPRSELLEVPDTLYPEGPLMSRATDAARN